MVERPVAAPRRKPPDATSHSALVTVIRTLTTSQSAEQRELQKTRLEKEFKESQKQIDKLVKDHKKDVDECLVAFRDVSTQISSCRQRIYNVRSTLSNCRGLLQSRRDDLKKLWEEDKQHRHVAQIMQQLEELREVKHKVDLLIEQKDHFEAAKLIAQSRDLIETRLSSINGLSQLRNQLADSSEALAKRIETQLAQMVVQEPFDFHMIDVVRGMPESWLGESELTLRLSGKLNQQRQLQGSVLSTRIQSHLAALSVLDGAHGVVERLLALSATQISKQVSESISLMRQKAAHDENLHGNDKSHLAQLIQMVVCQLESSRSAHAVLAECAGKIPQIGVEASQKVLPAFWYAAQSAVESLVSDHLDIASGSRQSDQSTSLRSITTQLFRFDAASYSLGSSFASPSSQASLTVCPPSPFNIVPMYPWLRRLMEAVEAATGVQMCQLRRFVHSFVMEMFVERVKTNLEERLIEALKLDDSRLITSGDSPILTSTERVADLCREVHELIVQMDSYAHRFAAIWVLVLTEYATHITQLYEKTTSPPMDGDSATRRKISSAVWAADEDISRLLMSLPNWILANSTQGTSPNSATQTPANMESEREVRDRNERESEILISNLGTQKQIERSELLGDNSDIRTLAALHESLRWFSYELRVLINSLPAKVRNSLRECKVTVKHGVDGRVGNDEAVLTALEEVISRLEGVSSKCLLVLHLELRVHCFYHLLPLARLRPSSHEDTDPEVVELGRDLQMFHSLLSTYLSPPKMRYIFDGLGHLCASIFIHSSQHMQRLTEVTRKRVSRNIWGVQQRLAQITARREAELDRARNFFELLAYDPDELLCVLADRLSQFSPIELNHLVALSVRSHPTLSSQRGVLDEKLSQLRQMLKR
ncbi:unnamed protein product, partial [Mesorhabditis belari]|uniref:Exocyst complex component Sec8 n=1 Tax=Mesorhabditis belari TaxID=2138241 RepID=A0AAF3ECK7_9BILA